ncbi:hypothetical protein [Lachnoclostridium sp. Marseille-P6806]|nr:hypothetical protein [Lachnoclostridium sp. Marseille-P6806]
MNNHADALIVHTAICAEAQMASDRSRKTRLRGFCGARLAQSASAW